MQTNEMDKIDWLHRGDSVDAQENRSHISVSSILKIPRIVREWTQE